jgi:hypothetical protein
MANANQGEALNWAHPDTSFFSDTFWLCQDVRDSDTYRTIADISAVHQSTIRIVLLTFWTQTEFKHRIIILKCQNRLDSTVVVNVMNTTI